MPIKEIQKRRSIIKSAAAIKDKYLMLTEESAGEVEKTAKIPYESITNIVLHEDRKKRLDSVEVGTKGDVFVIPYLKHKRAKEFFFSLDRKVGDIKLARNV